MAFDMGFNFRGSAEYVTDPAYGVPVLQEAYPHTYTNGNGQSVNAGWVDGVRGAGDLSLTVDVRLAGVNNIYIDSNGGIGNFKVDLSSGSAPGAGVYETDLALGIPPGNSSRITSCTVFDDAVARVTPVTTDTVTSGGTWIDASGTQQTPGTDAWDLVAQTEAVLFSSAIARLNLQNTVGGGNAAQLAHFRLTLQSSTSTNRSAAQRSPGSGYQRFRHH